MITTECESFNLTTFKSQMLIPYTNELKFQVCFVFKKKKLFHKISRTNRYLSKAIENELYHWIQTIERIITDTKASLKMLC